MVSIALVLAVWGRTHFVASHGYSLFSDTVAHVCRISFALPGMYFVFASGFALGPFLASGSSTTAVHMALGIYDVPAAR